MKAIPVLIVSKEGQEVKSFPVLGEMIVGRAEECNIRLNDRAISRQHALFRIAGDELQIENNSEFAPVVVNGVECIRAVLKLGDLIEVGPYQIRVSEEEQPPSQDAPGSNRSTAAPDGVPTSALEPAKPNGIDEIGIVPPAQGRGQAAPINEKAESQGPYESTQPSQSFAALDSEPGAVSQNRELEDQDDGGSSPDLVDEDARTKLTRHDQLQVQLIFEDGAANYREYNVTQDEVFIGRGKGCDIILNDKKVSRRNSMIRRVGLSFYIKDLRSSNGTYVNGKRVEEQELSSEDKITIGSAHFIFRATNPAYADQEKDFIPVPQDLPDLNSSMIEGALPEGASPPIAAMDTAIPSAAAAASDGEQISGVHGIPGISEVPGGLNSSNVKKDLVSRFKALPRRTQIIWLVAIGVFLLWVFSEDDELPVKNISKPKTEATKIQKKAEGPLTFDRLTKEQQAFVKGQYQLAFDLYKGHEYDRAIYEINKVLEILPNDESARDIKRYAQEGKQRMQAIEEEQKRKEEEARLKEKIAQLVSQTSQHVRKKEYDQAKELITQILELDPDNASVPLWRREIDAYEEALRQREQQKRVQTEINKQARQLFSEGMALKKKRHFYSAIGMFKRVADTGSSDRKLIARSRAMIGRILKEVARLRDPLLQEGRTAEASGEYAKAYGFYKKASRIDPHYPEAFIGMNRIKGFLHEKAKQMYTEAVLAESYSDFETAKKLFQECVEVAPVDDIYHERGARKLAHYFMQNSAPQNNANVSGTESQQQSQVQSQQQLEQSSSQQPQEAAPPQQLEGGSAGSGERSVGEKGAP